ncbi:MAG: UxaA family hydrolase [Gaiellaceae bacterium MAG52_C11]|nr:UxaA family hydrolase [Candidatus Gaiellasilicea maunaloa]
MHKALAHNQGDDVAVAVAAISAGEEILVVYIDDDVEQTIRARADVPYGHKLALQPLSAGAPVTEYSTQVGVARTDIELGDYVHTHNVKTARW